jgi:serine protease Do
MNLEFNRIRRWMVTLALIGAATLATVAYDYRNHAHAASTTPTAAAASILTVAPSGLPDISNVAARIGPAVVNISVSGTREIATSNDAEDDDATATDEPNVTRDLLRQLQQQIGGLPPQISVPMEGLGSGFIVRSDGVILTNAHLVVGATEVIVKLTDRREYRARVIGIDKPTDIAVLKIDALDLPTLALGSSQPIQVGEWVVAVGSPFGLENSVTVGVISATKRPLPGNGFVSFIQTDVAVNPGNSGGPLVNLRGEVVGINSQIYTTSGGYQGLSFAIPIDVAQNIERQLLASGAVHHASLGVVVQDVDQTLADSFKLAKPSGALVADVMQGGPAHRAGLEPGDVVLAANAKAIDWSADLHTLIGLAQPGDRVALEVWHRGARRSLHVVLDELKVPVTQQSDTADSPPRGRLGLALRPMQPEERRAADGAVGMVIERVGGSAARAGIKPGDLLLAIGGRPVTNDAQLRDAVGPNETSIALLVRRQGMNLYVPLHLQ